MARTVEEFDTAEAARPTAAAHRSPPLDDETLLARFLTPNMFAYFRVKCPELAPDELRRHIAELLKFLILVRDFPGNIIFGKEIDEIWHLWIMQTRQYEALCQGLPGGEMRHHTSRDYPEDELDAAGLEAFVARMRLPEAALPGPPPEEGEGRQRFEAQAGRLLSFFASYRASFGRLDGAVVPLWPPLQRMLERLGWSIGEFNAFLEGEIGKAARRRNVATG